ELQQLEDFLLDKKPLSEVTEIHQNWARELKKESFDEENVKEFIQQKVGDKFTRVLEDAGVYKQTEDGLKGFKNFIEKLNSN
ncbi:MAG TPA: UDP-glucose--hexose-1-phosphate uridylyltransferase, partial [Atopostipes sp.]|nr:UDP-glucose--hexose-1-phosphate uridylyltransferase [Atopostipes sp.]